MILHRKGKLLRCTPAAQFDVGGLVLAFGHGSGGNVRDPLQHGIELGLHGIEGGVNCEQLADVLKKLGAKRMIVGHTVQDKGINSACDDTLWRIDVGLAKLYDGPIQVLELPRDGAPRVIVGKRI